MDTREITQARPSGTKTPRRRPIAAVVIGLALVIVVAVIGALAIGSGVSDGGRQTTPAQVAQVAPGHTQPATLIHRIAMQLGEPDARAGGPGRARSHPAGHTDPPDRDAATRRDVRAQGLTPASALRARSGMTRMNPFQG